MDDEVSPVLIQAGNGEPIVAAGIEHQFLLTSEQSSGRLGIEEFVVPPSTFGPRPHIHRSHDESFYVLEGELTVDTAGGVMVLSPGDVAHAPRGALHGYRNEHESDVVRALCLYTPAGYEQYFRDVHAAAEAGIELTDEVLRDLRARYDTESPGRRP